ncbi:MAG: YfhO family protein [Leptolinea sp.]
MVNDPKPAGCEYSKWIYLPLILAPLILFLPALIPGKSLFWGITSIQFIPWHWAALKDIQQGVFPLWNSLNGLGAPLAANYQSALFYPPTWLVLIAGWIGGITWMAWAHGLLIVLHLIWAGWGMKSLTAYLGISPIPQVICGLAYGMCGYLVARGEFLSMVQASSWIPWILLAASQLAVPIKQANLEGSKNLTKPVFWLSLAFSGQWLSGHAQLAWYTLIFCCGWLFYGAVINGGIKQVIKVMLLTLAAGAIGFLVSSIQLIPTIEYFLQSQRSGVIDNQTALSYSFWPWRVITFLIPDFFGNPGRGDYWGYANYWEDAIYVGILPLFFAFNFVFGRGMNRFADIREKVIPFLWFAGITIVVAFVMALGWNTPVFPWLFEHVPTFGLFNGPVRWMILVEVCIILLAGFGAEEWIKHGFLHKKQINIWLTVVLAGIAGATGAWFFLPEINRTFVTSIMAVGVFLIGYLILARFKPKSGRLDVWRILIIGWLSLDLIWAGYSLNPVVDASFYQTAVDTKYFPALGSGQRIYWDSNMEKTQKFSRFFQFKDIRPTADMNNLPVTLLPNINILSNVALLNNFDPMVPARFAEFIKELAASPTEERNRYLSLANVNKVSAVNSVDIHEVGWQQINPLAEVRLVPCAETAHDAEESLNWMRSAVMENRLGEKIVVEVGSGWQSGCQPVSASNKAEIVTSERDKGLAVEIRENPIKQWLFIARTWYPGWQARIDGVKVDLQRADYLFMAIEVPAGNHSIELFYQPLSFQIGRLLSICGILIIIGAAVVSKIKKRKLLKKETKLV